MGKHQERYQHRTAEKFKFQFLEFRQQEYNDYNDHDDSIETSSAKCADNKLENNKSVCMITERIY